VEFFEVFMIILINGVERDVTKNIVSELLDELKIQKQTVIVELNESIINKDSFDITTINSGDKVEIVRFVGGG
jgi:thiamine biosynthesis protein ThiS